MSDASGVPPSPKTARALYFNAGFLVQKRVRRILELSGYAPSLGWPQKSDFIAVWGQSPTAYRGEKNLCSDRRPYPAGGGRVSAVAFSCAGEKGSPGWTVA